jgi:hypothetical protein
VLISLIATVLWLITNTIATIILTNRNSEEVTGIPPATMTSSALIVRGYISIKTRKTMPNNQSK